MWEPLLGAPKECGEGTPPPQEPIGLKVQFSLERTAFPEEESEVFALGISLTSTTLPGPSLPE